MEFVNVTKDVNIWKKKFKNKTDASTLQKYIFLNSIISIVDGFVLEPVCTIYDTHYIVYVRKYDSLEEVSNYFKKEQSRGNEIWLYNFTNIKKDNIITINFCIVRFCLVYKNKEELKK